MHMFKLFIGLNAYLPYILAELKKDSPLLSAQLWSSDVDICT